ncbi:FKBP-type peptidyl-prolyl cis-trans isomerase N-terminal domain-containing protein [Archangium violaceum]|uniref:FKBP-type peptidyl-prolyl cis-trans isomerase N-terminal domain-containing protein n=1 Tax=Archangium violaceum TaxID=83451 RepID=UPI002B2AA872|nr:FKBP-type peptidyl-prolyl cis-trans isomerase N-terminal domain-containing protein [Archangium gephyra]
MTRIGFILLCTVATAATAQTPASLATEKAQNSYALGQELASSIQQTGADLDINALLQGLRDNLEGKPSLLSAADLLKARDRSRSAVLQSRKKKLEEDKAKYGKAGQDYLAKHQKEKGVVTTPSGLQYVVLSPSPNPRPGPKNRVVFDYTASIAGGAEFESSAALGRPAVIGVSDGIKGLAEAFQLMPLGSRYRFVIPPQLAYGAEGMPGKVPPNATLIYEITLREVAR